MARIMYEVAVRHDGLNKYRHITGADRNVVQQKAEAQQAAWKEIWNKKQAADEKTRDRAEAAGRKSRDRENAARQKEALRQDAADQTAEAQEAISAVENILLHTLEVDDTVDWESLKDKTEFKKPPPQKPQLTMPPLSVMPPRPDSSAAQYRAKKGLLGFLIPAIARSRARAAESRLQNDLQFWEENRARIERENAGLLSDFKSRVGAADRQYTADVSRFDQERSTFHARQSAAHEAIDLRKAAYLASEPDAIIDYCEMVLSKSQYPDSFPRQYDLDYLPAGRMLLVDYALPARENLPSLKEVKFVQSKNELKESFLSEREKDDLYDDAIYKIALRTLHELFEADAVAAIDAVVFNGWVTDIERATGNQATNCIISIQAKKDELKTINLSKVDPKACFKALKGVGSSKLHSMTAIPPILSINKEDRRFIPGYDVADSLETTTNLAAIDWQDFEHLFREVFEKEFSQGGGEVKVTRASRDGGVDAIAFDPDPIRGGKIVIQAKRYTNTVGVSAVRDLYGTVMNEGATKGILVTTSDYGPDVYEFAKGKPLTLMSGSNLLYLLEKHGHRARIDLKEARSELGLK